MANKQVLPNEGLPDLLAYWIGQQPNTFADWALILWTNPSYTPSQASVYADLVEATFPGYSRVTLTKSSWLSPTIVGDKAVSTWGTTPVLWTNTGSLVTIYGFAYITPVSPKIRALELFDYPVPVVTGGQVGLLPYLEFTTEP